MAFFNFCFGAMVERYREGSVLDYAISLVERIYMKVWAKMVADFVYSCYTLPFFSSRDVLDNQMIEYIRQYMVMMMIFLLFFCFGR